MCEEMKRLKIGRNSTTPTATAVIQRWSVRLFWNSRSAWTWMVSENPAVMSLQSKEKAYWKILWYKNDNASVASFSRLADIFATECSTLLPMDIKVLLMIRWIYLSKLLLLFSIDCSWLFDFIMLRKGLQITTPGILLFCSTGEGNNINSCNANSTLFI